MSCCTTCCSWCRRCALRQQTTAGWHASWCTAQHTTRPLQPSCTGAWGGVLAVATHTHTHSAHLACQHKYPASTHPPLPHPARYLFTEFEDPEFGGRASAVHGAMLGALDGAGPPGKAVCNAIRKQTEVLSQLAYISKELKVRVCVCVHRLFGKGQHYFCLGVRGRCSNSCVQEVRGLCFG